MLIIKNKRSLLVFGIILVWAAMLSGITGCHNPESSSRENSETLIYASSDRSQSSSAGRLAAEALRQVHGLDFAFVPRDLIIENQFAYLPTCTDCVSRQVWEQLLDLYAGSEDGPRDQYIIGTLSGSQIKEFIQARSGETYTVDLEVSGLDYDVRYYAGLFVSTNIAFPNGDPIEDDSYYNVAISNFFFFSGLTFPSYKYRNGMQSGIKRSGEIVSLKKAILDYGRLTEVRWPDFSRTNAKVVNAMESNAQEMRSNIPLVSTMAVQGNAHRSPLLGKIVKVRGVVTARGINDWYPGGLDIIIQDPIGSENAAISSGLFIRSFDETMEIQIGDYIEVTGPVMERGKPGELTKTSIWGAEKITVISHDNPLPEAVALNAEIPIPSKIYSRYRGDLLYKQNLELTEGIDYWESLEGMRIAVKNPRVTGFRGGNELFESLDPKNYLNLYLDPISAESSDNLTASGGKMVDETTDDHNPEIIQMITHHLAYPWSENGFYQIGDSFDGIIEGVMSFEENIFGGGSYAFLPSQDPSLIHAPRQPLSDEEQSLRLAEGNQKLMTQLTALGEENALTVAAFNVKNLSADQKDRVEAIGNAIGDNLRCPDILSLVEIQDNNGVIFESGSSADLTLSRIIKHVRCPFSYETVNIDPLSHSEGGQPGGNIRVSLIYNPNKLSFTAKAPGDSLEEVSFSDQGEMSSNPARVFANDPIFRGTRKSLVAEFQYDFNGKSQSIFVVGNHFNSKLGDDSLWSRQQPPVRGSETRRLGIASKVNEFVANLKRHRPDSWAVVLGDFNDYTDSKALITLEGNILHNLMRTLPRNERYTSNFNGNASALDSIFVCEDLQNLQPEFEALHLNSDSMGRLSDHDPVLMKITH